MLSKKPYNDPAFVLRDTNALTNLNVLSRQHETHCYNSMSVEIEKLHWLDVAELAAHITETTEQFENDDIDSVEEKVMELFDCDLNGFGEIVSRLLPMVTLSKSELTGTLIQGFADRKKGMFILKREL
jgi:hypothetical protein